MKSIKTQEHYIEFDLFYFIFIQESEVKTTNLNACEAKMYENARKKCGETKCLISREILKEKSRVST